MLKKVTTKEYNDGLETKDSLGKVKAVDVAGNDILVSSAVVVNNGGCGKFTTNKLGWGKWYRIASSKSGADPNSCLLNAGNQYVNRAPLSQLFYISAEGFDTNQGINQLAYGESGKCISKARILYKKSTTEGPIIEILVNAPGANNYFFAYSCNIGFVFQEPVEVSETPEEGYSVKEFSF